jgi:hypothetical protein
MRIIAATAIALTPIANASPLTDLTETVDPATLDMTPAPEEVPLIGFLPPVQDFGTVSEGDLLEHVFWYTNNGTAPLTIEEARPTSPNMSVGLVKKPIEPGDMGEINVKVKTEGLNGPQTFRIKVKSDAWNGPSILYIRADIQPLASEAQQIITDTVSD